MERLNSMLAGPNSFLGPGPGPRTESRLDYSSFENNMYIKSMMEISVIIATQHLDRSTLDSEKHWGQYHDFR